MTFAMMELADGPGVDVLTCSAGTAIEGTPAQCDRMALAQVEYRHDITTLILGHSGGGLGWSFYHPVSGVVFLAKSLSDPGNPPNFVIRLRHRF